MAAPRTMRALQYDRYGGGAEGLKHMEVPIPSPQEGEVLLKMEAASINPIDWKIQKGMAWPSLPRKFPFIPVGDLSGEVVEVGSGVSNFKPGDKVISISFPGFGVVCNKKRGFGVVILLLSSLVRFTLLGDGTKSKMVLSIYKTSKQQPRSISRALQHYVRKAKGRPRWILLGFC